MSVTRDVKPYRVLVVDDLEHQRIAIKTAIGAVVSGCEFVEAANVTEAEDVLRKETLPFDLAVIDFKLGENLETGLALLEKNWDRYYSKLKMPVIIFTAYPDVKSACTAYEAGASSYISKLDADSTEKLQKRAKELLQQLDIREALRRQHKAQREAEEVFAKNRKKWIKKYGGKFVIVRNGDVVESKRDPRDLWEILGKYPTEQRCDMAILEVPLEEDKNG